MKTLQMRVLMRRLVVLTLTLGAGLWAQSPDELAGSAEKGDKAALQQLRALADKGDAHVQTNLGWMYQTGTGVPKDAVQAVAWYRKAAEQGNAVAQSNLGWMYQTGTGVPKDAVQAVTWYRKAADQGLGGAQFNLGVMYENGEGIPKDSAQAVAWYRKAADQGFAAAQNSLALMHGKAPVASGIRTNDILTNSAVVALVKAELPSDVILTKVKTSDCRFQLDVDGLIALKQARVSDEIIRAMLARNCGDPVTGNSSLSVPSNSNSQATPPPVPTAGVVSGRIFLITQGGDVRPARFAKVHLLYEEDSWAGVSNGESAYQTFQNEHKKIQDKNHLASAQQMLADLEALKSGKRGGVQDHERIDCIQKSLGYTNALLATLNWAHSHGKNNEIHSEDADEEGNFKSVVPPGLYLLIAEGSAGFNDAVWEYGPVEVKPGTQTTLKLGSPDVACLKR